MIKPLLLAILDGWGHGVKSATNAVSMARTPNLDRWSGEFPNTTLVAHNGAVGLPEGQMGNSEVGHLNIGAGRIVYQDFTRINRAIETGEFYDNQVLVSVMKKTAKNGAALHLMGLLSDGGVHSHIKHLFALVQMAAKIGLERVYVHPFTDGRDTPPASGALYMAELQTELVRIGVGRIATITGRYYAMDRDNRWDRVELAWHALVHGMGIAASDPVQAVHDAYIRGENDEFIKPIIVTDATGEPLATINDGDSVIFFNFRADRARELTHALTDRGFTGFVRTAPPQIAEYVTFTEYDRHFNFPVAFPPAILTHILGEEVSASGLHQLRIAETEKYPHVTYFFNGGREEPFPAEDRVMIPSPKEVATYDQKPEMSAYAVTDQLLDCLRNNTYSLIVLNFANGDMVGHTGMLNAAVKACEAVDQCLERLVREVIGQGGIVLITSDHGNAEVMQDPVTGEPFTAHTSNPVPFMLISEQHKNARLRADGTLTDIAPTILQLMGLPIPTEMTGRNLIN
ncbi:MAG: phosphoglycerate mutase (2,3-diphosphoglycerate-independent) [Deltaproteobacteria bacterium RIFOXYD12_FULL_50_9]|nr:MAG: phosphoglycerate mutase (2,3-diphosphoglycerate-independent) [Deltaproteobacteria bacterium RIFOXYD12_FULL_50_9]